MHSHQQRGGQDGVPHHHVRPPQPQLLTASMAHQQPPTTSEPQSHQESEAATSQLKTHKTRRDNVTKSELHALNNAPHLTIRISSTTHFSTFDQHGKPRQYYKYLGVFFYTSQQNQPMFLLLKNLVNSFFTNLLPLSLSHTELIKLSNIQLISYPCLPPHLQFPPQQTS